MILGSNLIWDDFKSNTIIVYLSHGLDSTSHILGLICYTTAIHLVSSIVLALVSFALNPGHFAHYSGTLLLSIGSFAVFFIFCVCFMILLSFVVPGNGNSFLFLLLFLGMSMLKFMLVKNEHAFQIVKWIALAIPNIDMATALKGRLLDKASFQGNLLHAGFLAISYAFLSTLCFDKIRKVWK